MKVLNLWGGPGIGKSATAARLFFEMKNAGCNVELVSEYAKDMVWERRENVLQDQLYLLAKQNRRLLRLKDHNLDYAIVDSPLIMGAVYAPEDYHGSYFPFVREIFDSYENVNFWLKRNHSRTPYEPRGRIQQSEAEAVAIDTKLWTFLLFNDIDVIQVPTYEFRPIFAHLGIACGG